MKFDELTLRAVLLRQYKWTNAQVADLVGTLKREAAKELKLANSPDRD